MLGGSRPGLSALVAVAAACAAFALPGAAFGDPSASETAGVSDTVTVTPPVSITVSETIQATDDPTLVPPVSVSVGEVLTATDSVGVVPPALVSASESIAANDTAVLTPPALLSASENITATDNASGQIVNTHPTIDAIPDGSANEGSAFSAPGSFVDPDSQTWTGTVDYGDNSGQKPVTIQGRTFQLNHVYDDNGTYTVTVTVSDGISFDTTTTHVTVDNVAPTGLLGNNGPIDEGSSATIAFTQPSDPSQADTTAGFRYAFACDGGPLILAALVNASTTPSVTCPFDDNGTHTVRARIIDKDSGFTEYTTDVEVKNVPPTAKLANNGPVDEGSPVTLTFSDQHDPSQADTSAGFSYRYACDGQAFGQPTGDATGTCTYDDGPSTHTILARIADKDGGFTEYSAAVRIRNVAPTGSLGNNGPVNEASPATISWSGQSDPSHADTQAGFTYRYACDGANLGPPIAAASATCTWDDGPSTHTVLSRITDKDGDATDRTTAVTVNNVAPTATFVVPTTPTNEGSGFTLALQNPADPSSADRTAGFKLEFDCGDGSGYAAKATCSAIDNPSQAVKGRITDKDGGSTEYTASVPVANVGPTATITGPPSGSLYQIGQAVSFTGTFTDPGVKDTHTARWSFDSLTTAGNVTESNGSGSANASFTFTAAGVYSVRLTVTDKDGASDTASTVNGVDALVVVYNPDGGFVTGGGWIDSPTGAYLPNPSLTGKATFGFVSKYEKGTTVPSGNTEFQFKAAGLNFQSTSYQWLVVAGTRAQFKGTGELNGSGGYGFMLTALDGSPDRLRMKILSPAGDLVYDNSKGSSDDIDKANLQQLGSGSIVIHK
jgi:hypothetical protein